jgi:hypothetical protein
MDTMSQFIVESQFSRLIDEFPDKKLFPKYYEAKKSEIILEKGEALFVPAGWFHWMFSETVENKLNVAINFWYKTPWDIDYMSYKNFYKVNYGLTIDHMKLLNEIKVPLVYSYSDGPFFPEQRVRQHFPSIKCLDSLITFQEFYDSGNAVPMQMVIPDNTLKRYSPPWCNTSDIVDRGSKWWINKGNMTSGLHYDPHDNWIFQLSGRKRVLLFPPDQYEKLYLINHYPQSFIKEVRRNAASKP